MIYTAEKAIKDNGGKIDATIVKGVEDKIADLKKAKDPSTSSGQAVDIDAIKKASEALSTEMQKIGEAMSKQPPTHDASASQGKQENGDNIKDAEFKEGK